MKLRFLFISVVMWCLSCSISAWGRTDQSEQTPVPELGLYMRVKNHLTHEDVNDSTLTAQLLWATDSSLVAEAFVSSNVWEGQTITHAGMTIHKAGEYLLHFQAENYLEKYVPISIPRLYKNETSRELKAVYLHRKPQEREHELGEIVVNATKLKFYMDGDTLVYSADAFILTEGSMIDALIRKLPGVELSKGGEITVNGRRVESLLLNGKDFFDSDRELMLENMPAYMVKNIRSYERTPHNAVGTNREKTEKKELVMDVRLKKDYHAGWTAAVEGGVGATLHDDHTAETIGADIEEDKLKHLGRLFGLRFSDQSRLVLAASSNDLNDDRTPGESGEWSPLSQSQGLADVSKAAVDYDYGSWEHFKYHGHINTEYKEKEDAQYSMAETFLQGGNTLEKSFNQKRSYDLSLYTRHDIEYRAKPAPEKYKSFSFQFHPQLYFLRYSNHSSATTERTDGLTMVNSTHRTNHGNGHILDTNGDMYLSFTPAHNEKLDFHLIGHYGIKDQSDDGIEHYRLDYYQMNPQTADVRDRYRPNSEQSYQFFLSPQFSYIFNPGKLPSHQLSACLTYNYIRERGNNPLYLRQYFQMGDSIAGDLPSDLLPNRMDMSNSQRTSVDNVSCSPQIAYTKVRQGQDYYSQFQASVSLQILRQSLDFWMGSQADTLVSRRYAHWAPSCFYIYNNHVKGRRLEATYNMFVSEPSITYLIPYTNTANPLYITYSNPDLKRTHTHAASMSYQDKWGRGTLFNAKFSGEYNERSVAYDYDYDRTTGARSVRPINVYGDWNTDLSAGVDFPIDKAEKWRVKENASWRYDHSTVRYSIGSSYLNNTTELLYQPTSKFSLGLKSGIHHRYSTSVSEDFSTIRVLDYDYGASAQVRLPWDVQLSTDLTMYSRRGYSDDVMNTDELVWNARLSKMLLMGRLAVHLDAFDILGQISKVKYSVNAQGRTETYQNVMPPYAMLRLSWRLGKKR